MDKKVPLWFLLLVLLFALIGSVLFGWVVQHKASGGTRAGAIGDIADAIANFPNLVNQTFSALSAPPQRVAHPRFEGLSGLTRHDPGFQDDGYLLIPRFDIELGQSIVDLLRLSDAQVLHTWVPDIQAINARSELHSIFANLETDNTPARYRIFHPLLMPDGGLVFQSASPLVRIDACSDIEWVLNGLFHHTAELAPDGNIWVPSVIEPSSMPERLFPYYRDDSIALVSPDGRLLRNDSVSRILLDNGYRGLLLGAGPYDINAIHINDIDPAWRDGRFWKRGDVLLSLRNRSTVFIYRPSTGRIVWSRTGPWLNQHDPDFVGDHQISVFGNDIVITPSARIADLERNKEHYLAGESNQIYLVNLEDDSVRLPFEKGMRDHEVRTLTEGRSQLLDNGDVFIEETKYGRLLRMAGDGSLRWSYVNRLADGGLYLVSWARYLTPQAVEPFLRKKETLQCNR